MQEVCFQNQMHLAGRTSLIQTIRAWTAQAGCSVMTIMFQAPLSAAQRPELLVLSPLITISRSCHHPSPTLPCWAGVSSVAGSPLAQTHFSCSLAQMCCPQIHTTAWVSKWLTIQQYRQQLHSVKKESLCLLEMYLCILFCDPSFQRWP